MVENLINSKSQIAQLHTSRLFFLSNAMKISLLIFLSFIFSSMSINNNIKINRFIDGSVESKIPMINGLKNGLQKVYTKQGNLKYTTIFKNGKKNGIERWFDREGKLISSTMYRDNIIHGTQKLYYPNGVVMIQRNFVNGRQNGPVTKFDEHAIILSIESSTDNLLEV